MLTSRENVEATTVFFGLFYQLKEWKVSNFKIC